MTDAEFEAWLQEQNQASQDQMAKHYPPEDVEKILKQIKEKGDQ